jgi:hypothetical protein
MIIGSQWPWVEAICLYYGAKKVITVDYYKNLISEHPSIEFRNAISLGHDYKK